MQVCNVNLIYLITKLGWKWALLKSVSIATSEFTFDYNVGNLFVTKRNLFGF